MTASPTSKNNLAQRIEKYLGDHEILPVTSPSHQLLNEALTALRGHETSVARTPCDDCLADRNRLSAELEQYKAWHRGGRSNVEFLGDGVRICNGEHENHEPCQFVEYRRAEEPRESADLRHKLAAVLEPHACRPGRVQVIVGKSDTFWSIVQALAGSSVEPTPAQLPCTLTRGCWLELGHDGHCD